MEDLERRQGLIDMAAGGYHGWHPSGSCFLVCWDRQSGSGLRADEKRLAEDYRSLRDVGGGTGLMSR